MDSKHIELIEKHILGQISSEEARKLDELIKQNPFMEKEIANLKLITEGVERYAMRQEVQKAFKKYRFRKSLKMWTIVTFFIAIAMTVGFYIFSEPHQVSENTNKLPALNENNESIWADADKYIATQYYSIDTKSDTVIESDAGIIFAIPANSFVDELGNPVSGIVELEIKDALDPMTIIQGGLSTASEGKQLETGGMFYFNARQEGKNLNIAQGADILADIPTDKKQQGMMLFDGKRQANGGIEWTDPKPLRNDLIPVDITTLNFYPPEYLDSLQVWDYNIVDKKFTDSLYYSFASEFDRETMSGLLVETKNSDDSLPELNANLNIITFINDSLGLRIQSETVPVSPTNPNPKATQSMFPVNWEFSVERINDMEYYLVFNAFIDEGWQLYSQNLPDGGPLPTSFIYNTSNDYMIIDDVIEVLKPKSTFDEAFQMDVRYFEGFQTFKQKIRCTRKFPINIYGEISYMVCNTKTCGPFYKDFYFQIRNNGLLLKKGINPAKIKSIWNKKFNGTILATREFEERLQSIHQSCDNAILDLYVNNLEMTLAEIDSKAASNTSGELSAIFREFASRNDGGIDMMPSSACILKKYYERKTKLYSKLIREEQNNFWNSQNELNKQSSELSTKEYSTKQKEISARYQAEIISRVKKELKKYKNVEVPIQVYRAPVQTTGWKNIDAYLTARNQLTSTMEQNVFNINGTKYTVNFSPLSFSIRDAGEFERIMVYLIPTTDRSFQRLYTNGKKFKTNVNDEIDINLFVLAIKDQEQYYYKQKNVSGALKEIELSHESPEKIKEELLDISFSVHRKTIEETIENQEKFIVHQKRQELNRKRQKRRESIRPVIFPCI